MDIYSEEGTKVRFRNKGGYDSEPKNAVKARLVEGEIYTVNFTNVGGWSSDVILKEFPGRRFNTVMFEEV
jgi:hypothetical protein